MKSFPTFQVDDEGNEEDSKKACLLSSMEAMSPSESLNGIREDPPKHKECPVNGTGEHEDTITPVVQINPTRFYFNWRNILAMKRYSCSPCSFSHIFQFSRGK